MPTKLEIELKKVVSRSLNGSEILQDFLGITPYQTIPSAKTIWLFAEQMKNAKLEEKLFDKFLEMLESKGIHPQGGTFVEVPRQHNTKTENAQLKKSEIPEEFKSNPHRLAQKECEGNWAKKRDAAFFGYKNHPWIDAVWKLMRGYDPQICEKGYRNHPLTEEQKESNRLKSKVRC